MACTASQASGGLLSSSKSLCSLASVSTSHSVSYLSPNLPCLRNATLLSRTQQQVQWKRRNSGRLSCLSAYGALTPELKEALDKFVTSNKVVLFMKGTKLFPQCGFSNTVVQILNSLNVPYETVNILENEDIRAAMKIYSSWPTFPQLYIDGEFFGGCDITLEAYKSGQLQEVIEKAMCS
ncbi:hypothetical protein KP509_22G051100 [Ceratopteris richardii]|uniref:Glutaredoxin domain-containing protein n=1 Tax=Ceratopteris richardii TaxID=49495 RepID=A0A8T2S614_CERRI|nr:hypothetical protein KP509_22G051100 [Ceratopteris richardii]